MGPDKISLILLIAGVAVHIIAMIMVYAGERRALAARNNYAMYGDCPSPAGKMLKKSGWDLVYFSLFILVVAIVFGCISRELPHGMIAIILLVVGTYQAMKAVLGKRIGDWQNARATRRQDGFSRRIPPNGILMTVLSLEGRGAAVVALLGAIAFAIRHYI